ncbi:MAG: hypothetical protein ABL984_19505 [Pyrinomonadaceae bacterium]
MKKVKQNRGKSKAAYVVVLAIALIAAGIVVFTNSSKTGRTVSAQSERAQKKYRGTRRIVKDEATGEFRLPTEAEADKVVADLANLTKRPDDLPSTVSAGGGVSIDLEGGYGGTFVARPKADGTMETLCVFSLEEGLEFLGFVEVSE